MLAVASYEHDVCASSSCERKTPRIFAVKSNQEPGNHGRQRKH
ncbi:hypothetical protein HMPREF1862_00292 [Varibaculum cambriense]|uniref:Uncharacterized protein n=1 Tax=Varibaculum cambriense TaxID=184870 RepID=A0AB34X1H3_9ACTO|nr:hypothetical protein HMPREF1862_00292 [Varibaculum cambriense]